MADENMLIQAQTVFDTFCQVFDEKNWPYKKDEKELVITSGARGDDLPMDIMVEVEPKRQLVFVVSHIPFDIPEEKRLDFAIAVSFVNNKLSDGCFDYDIVSGHILFRMANSFIDSQLNKDVFEYMLYYTCVAVDSYNDKLMMLSKGHMSLEQFLSAE